MAIVSYKVGKILSGINGAGKELSPYRVVIQKLEGENLINVPAENEKFPLGVLMPSERSLEGTIADGDACDVVADGEYPIEIASAIKAGYPVGVANADGQIEEVDVTGALNQGIVGVAREGGTVAGQKIVVKISPQYIVKAAD